MLRVALLDDHPAVLTGLQRLLASTPDLQPVAAAHSAQELLRDLDRSRPDVVVADYDLARGDGQSVSAEHREAAIGRLDPDDVSVAAMLLAGTSHQAIAETLATDRRDVVRRIRRIVGQLRPTAPPNEHVAAELVGPAQEVA